MTRDIYDWDSQDEDAGIIIRHQYATAVYLNPHDTVVIRQEDHYGDEDCFVYIRPENVLRLVRALIEAAGIDATIVEG
jgi:hypothetical protein